MSVSRTSSSTTTDGTARSIAAYRQLYENADKFSREVAEFRQSIAIPAHNELRYAGHHLLQALDDSGTVAVEEQLRRACIHCERAMYEAAEAGIISLLGSISQFQEDYKDIVVVEVVPEYGDCKATARRAKDLLIRGRSKDATATDTASEYMHAFRELRAAGDMLEDARDDLNAKLADQRTNSRRFVATAAITLLGSLVAAAFIVYRLM